MHLQALAFTKITNDIVAWNGVTTGLKMNGVSFATIDQNSLTLMVV
jgi:hypothetical protein